MLGSMCVSLAYKELNVRATICSSFVGGFQSFGTWICPLSSIYWATDQAAIPFLPDPCSRKDLTKAPQSIRNRACKVAFRVFHHIVRESNALLARWSKLDGQPRCLVSFCTLWVTLTIWSRQIWCREAESERRPPSHSLSNLLVKSLLGTIFSRYNRNVLLIHPKNEP